MDNFICVSLEGISVCDTNSDTMYNVIHSEGDLSIGSYYEMRSYMTYDLGYYEIFDKGMFISRLDIPTFKQCFISMAEWREQQIKEILNG